MTHLKEDKAHMDLALQLAQRGWGTTAPNPMVGAVVVRAGRVIGQGYHQFAGGPHAEVNALAKAGIEAQGATLYVTLEPCNHTGRTPPCTQAILDAGIHRVVSAMEDPNPLVAGGGHQRLKRHGLEVKTGIRERQAKALNEIFIKNMVSGNPFVAVKCAATMDGRLATHSGSSKWITGAGAREHVHYLRHGYDAILVGIDTILADDPSLTTRLPDQPGRNPLRVVLDTKLRIPEKAKVLRPQDDSGTVIYTGRGADPAKRQRLESAGHRVVALPLASDRIDFGQVLDDLGQIKVTSVLIEGGGGMIGSALNSKRVDKVYFFYGPLILGGDDGVPICRGPGPDGIQDSITIYRRRVSTFGDDILIEGYLSQN